MRKLFAMIMACVALLCLGICAQNKEPEKLGYEEYIYPLRQENEEWRTLVNHQDMIDICQLPREYLNAQTIDLLATVLHYPLLGDIFAWNSVEMGFDVVSLTFNGFAELLNREDLLEAIESFDIALIEFTQDFELPIAERVLTILQVFAQSSAGVPDSLNATQITDNTVTTPNGTQVPHYVNMTWADHGISTTAQFNQLNSDEDYYDATYTSAYKISGRSPRYNCHSYAWHQMSTNNPYWINFPDWYINDSYYTEYSYMSIGDRVVYYFYPTDMYTHTSVVTNQTAGSSYLVISKWGYFGLYLHPAMHCPYYNTQYTSLHYYHH